MNSEPTEGAGMIEAMAWFEVNKKRLAVGAVLAIVGGFGIFVWNDMAHRKEIATSAALVRLRTAVNVSTNQTPAPAADFLKIADSNPGSAAAERAIVLGASALFSEGKYADAQTQFERLIKDHPASPWVSQAAYGIAASLEASGKQDDALTAYQRVVTSYGTDPVANQARLSVARIHEAKNQPDLALKQYDEITKPSGLSAMSRFTQDAYGRREKLLKKFPNLVKPATNAPAMMTTGVNMPAVKPATNAVLSGAPAVSTPANTPAATNNPAGGK